MKDKILAFFKEKQNVLWQTCIILCSFYVAFSNDSFSLNPYFLILLLLLTKNSNIIFILFSISALILGSFLKSINYGIELSLACFLYLVLLFFPRYKKSYRQLYITNTLYFLAFISIYLLKKSPTSILINFGISYLIVQFFTFYLNQNEKNNLFYGTYIFLLIGIFKQNYIIFKILFYLVILLNLKNEKLSERLSLIFIESLISYSFYLESQEEILSIIISSFFASLILKQKFRIPIFVILYSILFSIKYPATFYKTTSLYLPIISLCLYYLIVKKEDIIVVHSSENSLLAKIKNISDYLMLIEEKLPIPNIEIPNIKENLKLNQCKNCSKAQNCTNIANLSEVLPSSLQKNFKKEILTSCPNGSKLIYRYKVVKDMVNLEMKNSMIEEGKQSAIKTIIKPLKELCDPKLITIDSNYFNNIFGDNVITYFADNYLKSTKKLTPQQINIIEKTANKTISKDTYYSLLFQSYTYKFIPNKIHFTFDYATKSFSRQNGDSIILFQDESYFEFALFDAMGHFESSGKYSLFAKRLFEITRHKGNDFFERIKELNKILICQSTVENYIAADFFIKDQNSNKYLLYKFGSAKTILKHNHKTIEFTNFLPPLGIIKDLKNEPFIIELEDKDTIIFSTDGIESIEKIDFNNNQSSLQILNDYLSKHQLTDDSTICRLIYKA